MFNKEMSPAEFLMAWFPQSFLPEKEQAVFDHYYSSYIRHFGLYLQTNFDALTQSVRDYIAQTDDEMSILDIGCGCGTESLHFAMMGERVRVCGLDLNEKYLEVGRARTKIVQNDIGRHLQCEFLSSSVFDIPREGKFDVIWMSQTFHHVEPREEFVPLIASLLKPGGLLVISEANAWHPLLQMSVIRQRGFRPKRVFTTPDGREHPFAHERITTPGNLSRLFAKCGVERVAIHMQRVFPNYSLNDKFMLFIEEHIPSVISPAFTQYVYTGRKTA